MYPYTMCAQININVTQEFDKDLTEFMKKTGIQKKSEAIREAVSKALELLQPGQEVKDFREWLGLGLKSPPNQNPKFKTHDDLWNK